MTKTSYIAGIRVILAVGIIVAVAYQYWHGMQHNPQFSPGNFFSFFTIQSNIFAGIVLFAGAWFARKKRQSATFDVLRGAATLYMVMTGVIYVLLLSGNEVSLQTTVPWVNLILHYLMPIAVFTDWLVNPPSRIVVRHAAGWLLFPVLYVVYSLVRGSFVGWYPYPFLSIAQYSYAKVMVNCVVIGTGAAALCWIVYRLGSLQQRSQRKKA